MPQHRTRHFRRAARPSTFSTRAFWTVSALMVLCLTIYWTVLRGREQLISDIFVGAAKPFFSLAGIFSDRSLPFFGESETTARNLRELREELARAELELARLRHVEREKQELIQLHQLAGENGWGLVFAKVIVRDPLTWNQHFRIDKGSRHGIKPGFGVIAGRELIGVVATCESASATVVTVADLTCRLSVSLRETGATGILTGNGKSEWNGALGCIVNFLPDNIVYKDGQIVETSGLALKIPGGLTVGKIVRNRRGETTELVDGAYRKVLLKPSDQLARPRYVGVALPHVYPGETN